MPVKELLENIYLIKVPLPDSPLRDLNSYYIKGEERSLLVDTGFRRRECREALTKGLAALGADMAKTDIFLTHMHYDHVGLAPAIAVPGTRIYMGKQDRQAILRYADPQHWARRTKGYLVTGVPEDELKLMTKDNADPRMAAFGEYLTPLSDGDVLDVGAYRFECIETPGHTPGHLCLYEGDKGILLCGDHVLFDISPNIIDWDEMEDSLGSYMRSLERVGKLKVKHVFCGHREFEGDFYDRVSELLSHHRERLEETLGILKEHGGLTAYDAASRMSWSVHLSNWDEVHPFQKMFAVGEALAHLNHLVCQGEVGFDIQNGKNIYYKK